MSNQSNHCPIAPGVIAGLLACLAFHSPRHAVAGETETRLRVTVRDAGVRVGTFEGSREDTLMLVDSDGLEQSISYSSIQTIERSRGLRGNSLMGAGIGFCVGGLIGAWIGVASTRSDDLFVSHPAANGMGGFIAGGFYGMTLGALVGMAVRSEKWESVPIGDVHLLTRFSMSGGPELGLVKRF